MRSLIKKVHAKASLGALTRMLTRQMSQASQGPTWRLAKRQVMISGVACLAWGQLSLSGCASTDATPKLDQLVQTPQAWSESKEPTLTEQAPALEQWCSGFERPELERLVQRAFEGNLSLRAAWSRLAQSEAVRRQTDSALYPTLDASAQAQRQRTALQGPQARLLPDPTFTLNLFQGSLAAGYEVDLWGRLKAQRQAAALDVQAARADVEAMAVSMTSEVAEAWFDVVHQGQKRALLMEQIALNERYIELLTLRLANASATALDINQQEQQVDSLRGQLTTIEATQRRATLRLATLLGMTPMALDQEQQAQASQATMPELGPLPALGLPATLLERRPDLRAARQRLEASNARIAAAVRSRLPTVRLSLSVFVQATALAELLDQILWSALAQATQPIVDGGRRAAEVEQAQARQDELFYSYAHAFISALSEVEGALVQEHQQREALKILEANLDRASQAVTLAQRRYQSGATDYLRVLTAVQALQTLEQSVLDAQRRQLSNRVQLCRALGGGWTQALTAPTSPEEPSR